MKKPQSQNERILAYLKKGGTLTPLQGLRMFDTWALSSRIAEINKPRRIIHSELVTVKGGKKVARYSMIWSKFNTQTGLFTNTFPDIV